MVIVDKKIPANFDHFFDIVEAFETRYDWMECGNIEVTFDNFLTGKNKNIWNVPQYAQLNETKNCIEDNAPDIEPTFSLQQLLNLIKSRYL